MLFTDFYRLSLRPSRISRWFPFQHPSFVVGRRLDQEENMQKEEALKKSDELLAELSRSLKAGRSERLVAYLEMLGRFHQYSFGNLMLIAMQKPDATYVAGFNRWKELGRFVKKGESGIAILAPVTYRKPHDNPEQSEDLDDSVEARARVVRAFRVVHVFDISQTAGKDLPTFAKVEGDPGGKLELLELVVRSNGIELAYDELPFGTLGTSKGGLVTIRPGMSPALTFSVLAHELGHELLRHKDRRENTSKALRETEAEAVAFVVTRASGLESSSRSADYVQLWGGSEALLRQSLELIRTVASSILSDIASFEAKEVADVA